MAPGCATARPSGAGCRALRRVSAIAVFEVVQVLTRYSREWTARKVQGDESRSCLVSFC